MAYKVLGSSAAIGKIPVWIWREREREREREKADIRIHNTPRSTVKKILCLSAHRLVVALSCINGHFNGLVFAFSPFELSISTLYSVSMCVLGDIQIARGTFTYGININCFFIFASSAFFFITTEKIEIRITFLYFKIR